jgi:hypothetical protein
MQKICLDENFSKQNLQKSYLVNNINNLKSASLVNNKIINVKKDFVGIDSSKVILRGVENNKVLYANDNEKQAINDRNAINNNLNSEASDNYENEYVNKFFQNKNSKFINRRKTKISVKVQMKYFEKLKKDK